MFEIFILSIGIIIYVITGFGVARYRLRSRLPDIDITNFEQLDNLEADSFSMGIFWLPVLVVLTIFSIAKYGLYYPFIWPVIASIRWAVRKLNFWQLMSGTEDYKEQRKLTRAKHNKTIYV